MARQKYYTVGVSNKFSTLVSDGEVSSDDEVILSEAPHDEQPNSDPKKPIVVHDDRRVDGNRQDRGHNDHGKLRDVWNDEQGKGGRNDYPSRPRGGFRGRGVVGFRGLRGGNFVAEVTGSQESTSNGVHDEGKAQRTQDFSHDRSFARGRGRGQYSGRGREFDRHSKMGRRPDSKRNGSGGYNWGNESSDQIDRVASQDQMKVQPVSGSEESGTENDKPTENVEDVSPKPQQEEMIDFEAYQAQLAAKRSNLPIFSAKKGAGKITTVTELEAQGYTKHEKNTQLGPAGDGTCHATEDSDGEKETPTKKKFNVYEYIHNEGGHIRPLVQRRGRDRPGRQPGREKPKARDAPDIGDERAFPRLG